MSSEPKNPDKPKLEDLPFEEVNNILMHKWILSEKEKKDVGLEYAMEDYLKNHSMFWRQKKLQQDLTAQKEEIIKHKWYLSEKFGCDVGMTPAALDWVKCGYAAHWRNKTGPYKKTD